MYIKENDTGWEYYSVFKFKEDNPAYNDMKLIPQSTLIRHGVYYVIEGPKPIKKPTEKYVRSAPFKDTDGYWKFKWTVEVMTPDEVSAARIDRLKKCTDAGNFRIASALSTGSYDKHFSMDNVSIMSMINTSILGGKETSAVVTNAKSEIAKWVQSIQDVVVAATDDYEIDISEDATWPAIPLSSIIKTTNLILDTTKFRTIDGIYFPYDTFFALADEDIRLTQIYLDEKAKFDVQSIADAKATIIKYINDFVEEVTGVIPNDEKLSWDLKAKLAQNFVDNAVTDPIIEEEALITGESVTDLCNNIVTKAALYKIIIAKTAGLRRKTFDELDNGTSPAEALASALAQTEVMKTELGI